METRQPVDIIVSHFEGFTFTAGRFYYSDWEHIIPIEVLWYKILCFILCFLKYINNDLGPMISLEIFPSAPTKLMSH